MGAGRVFPAAAAAGGVPGSGGCNDVAPAGIPAAASARPPSRPEGRGVTRSRWLQRPASAGDARRAGDPHHHRTPRTGHPAKAGTALAPPGWPVAPPGWPVAPPGWPVAPPGRAGLSPRRAGLSPRRAGLSPRRAGLSPRPSRPCLAGLPLAPLRAALTAAETGQTAQVALGPDTRVAGRRRECGHRFDGRCRSRRPTSVHESREGHEGREGHGRATAPLRRPPQLAVSLGRLRLVQGAPSSTCVVGLRGSVLSRGGWPVG
ncbi:hypothetical protein GA0070606_3635 [Micromonospora citrea]|uniref:Uncharacterized protein n=1 Tax=Micromonospora citrea TaxID=47855 RepID=A0A1C6V8C0_9ACTN|nr:hypothetical protein GA0070606_3635 [Micromonospora citrea]